MEGDTWQVLVFSALSYSCLSLFRASAEAVAAMGAGGAENTGNFLGWQGLRQGREEMLDWGVL